MGSGVKAHVFAHVCMCMRVCKTVGMLKKMHAEIFQMKMQNMYNITSSLSKFTCYLRVGSMTLWIKAGLLIVCFSVHTALGSKQYKFL